MLPHVRFKTQRPANSTNFVPRFSLATCSVCLFRSTTRPNKAQRMMGMHLLIVAVVPNPSASALLQPKNDTFCPEDLLCEIVTVHNDIKTLFSSWYRTIDNLGFLDPWIEGKSGIVSCNKPTREISNTDKLKVWIQPPVVVNWEILWSINQSSSGICILGQGQ